MSHTLERCETCKTVWAAMFAKGVCRNCGAPTRPLADEESEAYIGHGHEAFADICAVKDERGGVLRYDVVA